MAERDNRKLVEKMRGELHPVLLHKELLGRTDKAVIFLLPDMAQNHTLGALNELPYPIIGVDMPIDDGFPADMGTVVGKSLYITRNCSRLLSCLMESVGIQIDYTNHPKVKTPHGKDMYMAEGGTMAIDSRTRRAVTSSNNAFLTLQNEGYHTATISPETVIAFAEHFRNDWIYQVYTRGWFSQSSAHIDPLVTLFSDRGQSRSVVDENMQEQFEDVIPHTWNLEPLGHQYVLGGALNLAYIDDDYVLAPPRENMGDLAKQLDRSGYNLIHLPDSTVSDMAGPKCRTLVVPL